MPSLTLYYKPSCPYCHKVLQFMESHDIELPLKNLMENSFHRQELLEIGGKGQVPCLMIDGQALYESDDIISWLDSNVKA